MYQLGIDLGGSSLTVGVVDAAGHILARQSCATGPDSPPQTVMQNIRRCAAQALQRLGVPWRDCTAAGLGSPGNCDPAAGFVRRAHNLGWDAVPAVAILQETLQMPVFLDNDASCALRGECFAGAARGCRDALLITLGTGIGGALLLGGVMQRGSGGLGGEVGHLCIALEGEVCTCGERGCWEAYASARALCEQAERALAAAPPSQLAALRPLNGEKIYAAARAGDALACTLTAQYARAVAVGLVSLINLLYPQRILLGGGMAAAGEALFAPVRDYAARHSFVRGPDAVPPEILPAQLGSDAGILGAALLCRETEGA